MGGERSLPLSSFWSVWRPTLGGAMLYVKRDVSSDVIAADELAAPGVELVLSFELQQRSSSEGSR